MSHRPFRRSASLVVLLAALMAAAGCVRTVYLPDLSPPTGPTPEELAEKAKFNRALGYTPPAPGARAALVSCAATFRPTEEGLVAVLTQLAPQEVRRAVADRFCASLVEHLAEDDHYTWLVYEEVVERLPVVRDAEGQQAAVYDRFPYYGGLASAFPALNAPLREAAQQLETDVVFLAALDVAVGRRRLPVLNLPVGAQRFDIHLVQIAGYEADRRVRVNFDFAVQLSPWRHYYFAADDSLEGLEVLAEAVAKAFMAEVRARAE
jgi:hypothetical protein